jgi:hypothetical protein
MSTAFQLGSRVRLQHDDGWGQPGCVMASVGTRLRIYWPDENVFTDEFPSSLAPYGVDATSQPPEVAA